MPEIQQRKFLGVGEEHTLNLGHPSTQDRLSEHPLDRVQNYDSGDTGRVGRGPARSQSVYGKFRDPKDGHDFAGWASYAREGSYTGRGNKAGLGKDPPTTDDSRRTVPDVARAKNSDGYLESTRTWANLPEAGGDSGVGRLEKAGKR
jgi:hypothetical protein